MHLACAATAAALQPSGTPKRPHGHLTFVHNTLLHLSVALCRGNCWVLRKGLHELAKATGRQFQRGLLPPIADLVA